MKKYILYVLSLYLFINPIIATNVLIVSPERFSTSSDLESISLIYGESELPSTCVVDTKLNKITPDILTSRGSNLFWAPSGTVLTHAEYDLVDQARGAFGVVRLVQSMWRHTLDSFPKVCPVTGCTPLCKALDNWNKQPILTIDSHAECMIGCQLNAYYDPSTHTLVFPQFLDKGRMKYTCSSFDVVAHESGHACLNAMCPTLSSDRSDHRALHESFGDLTALFASLDIATPTQQIKWLSSPHTGTCIGGDLTGTCIRDPHDGHSVSCEAHDLSKPLTRFMCDYMNHLWQTKTEEESTRDILYQAQQDFLEAMLYNLDSKNILQSIIDYFATNKVSIRDSYFAALTAQFTSCSLTDA
jgi:hypothetical protein